ncbi:MAG: aminopeptidase [Bacilli bacterium]|nr:aminopeptidase [Bacilli bacterium]
MYSKSIYETADEKKIKKIFAFCEDYKHFISIGKTERLCVKEAIKLAEKSGYVNGDKVKNIKKGDKLYFVNKDKNIALYQIGSKPLVEGLRILGAHIDSPRLDIKQNPLYQQNDFALLDTHYYGGIKKYQWVTTALAIHGVVCKKDGKVIEVSIGEKENEPVVGVNDLLIHLARDQMGQKLGDAINGEKLDITFGSIPLKDSKKDGVKANILKLLKEKYGIEEEDFLSSELEVVPAGPARDYGFDASMIAGYGHDDRVCAYTSLMAILDSKPCEYTSCCILVDKEEIGSVGSTGAHSLFFENSILKLLHLSKNDDLLALRETMENSKMLNSDVSAGFDPLYPEVNDPKNSAYLNKGIVFNKYTGSGGKGGSNDANPEFFAWIRKVMDESNVYFQTSELGKVDQGGGGTIAYILGNKNMNVVDAGVPVLNMHAPLEVVAKADVYEAYLAYIAFLTK